MDEPVLDVDNIQGNIAPGFGKPVQLLVGVGLDDAASARALLADLLPKVTTMREVYDRRVERKAFLAAGMATPGHPDKCWLNLALSAKAMLLLGHPEVQSLDPAFRLGMAARSRTLGDPVAATVGDRPNRGHKSNWVVGGPHNEAALLIIIAADAESAVDEEEAWLREKVAGGGGRIMYSERGRVIPGAKEHFGFRDDISHPGVRGVIKSEPPEYLTTRYLNTQPAGGPEFSRPGQPLIWPGQFIIGHLSQSQVRHTEPGNAPSNLPPAAIDGSFLVFRRLLQDVRGFYADTDELAGRLSTKPGWEDMTGGRLRALLVGRWPSGLPLMRVPEADDPAQAEDRFAVNHFAFNDATPPAQLVTGEVVPGAPADKDGLVCPQFAHVRKINPRDRDTDQGASVVTLSLRILRRGIPFGPTFDHEQPGSPLNEEDRGLLFISYQASIERQFEVINSKWMNSAAAPEGDKGVDLLVGQKNGADGDRTRMATLLHTGGSTEPIKTLRDWVIPTGGGYFFAPSIKSLTLLAG